MKKLILLITLSSTFIMCTKKSEATNSPLKDAVRSADSTLTAASENINEINNTAEAVFDSANVKIKEFDATKNDIKEKIEATSKSVDSLSQKIAATKLESKKEKKDSTEKKSEKIVINVPSPKVIKETKVIYRNKTNKENNDISLSKNKMVKTGTLELNVENVENVETAKEIVQQEVRKYDGFIRSESISSNNDHKKIAYLKAKVPIQKFEYLMDDLSSIGTVENKGIELSGQNYLENTMCDLEITLYGAAEGYAKNDEPKTFADRSFAAISSGWDVITGIFLFILPFWPLFLIGAVGYYFYKKKNKNATGDQIN
ncbi:hypothetical protein CEY12_21330 [Chryseobacterium sp. T16E-39]|uniref:DUF4349 domain-containing protein n=1 Tax=Chryseobacterium sp. T16E-39 TaxID=2015076 RepID=UPI000B5B3236|nr:DUF4349 domain-containing protein [Chryseobacterium sp. T16E-39]ASK32469.1 hypothetical protein CEY12_21330 [Chryseobacterium sp. T16E-39]